MASEIKWESKKVVGGCKGCAFNITLNEESVQVSRRWVMELVTNNECGTLYFETLEKAKKFAQSRVV